MKPIDYILLGAVAAVLTAIVIRLTQKKKNGESDCGCNCKNCPNASGCGRKKPDEKEQKNA